MNTPIPPTFATEQDAFAWMRAEVDDPCVDNERLAYHDDADARRDYANQVNTGCCGFFDRAVVIAGRAADIGCNYGH